MTADEIMALADVLLDETQPQFKAEQAHAALHAAVEQLCRRMAGRSRNSAGNGAMSESS